MKGKYLKSIYELNKEGCVQINTPCGITQDIEIGETLKRGTILAAPICANHIDKGMEPIIKKKTRNTIWKDGYPTPVVLR